MNTDLFCLDSPNGKIRGNFSEAKNSNTMVLMCCGLNGFYHFGMFPTIQEYLNKSGISSITFSYSHCGISDEGDYFDDLERYEKNCRKLEKEDIQFMLKKIAVNQFGKFSRVILFAHSIAGIPASFAFENMQRTIPQLKALHLLCSMKTLAVRTENVMNEWKENGVYFRENGRTKQQLPQGKSFLQETLEASTTWNLETCLKKINLPIFVAHSVEDEAVLFECGETIFSWIKEKNELNQFLRIENANHTLNTSHLGNRDSEELQSYLNQLVAWIENVK